MKVSWSCPTWLDIQRDALLLPDRGWDVPGRAPRDGAFLKEKGWSPCVDVETKTSAHLGTALVIAFSKTAPELLNSRHGEHHGCHLTPALGQETSKFQGFSGSSLAVPGGIWHRDATEQGRSPHQTRPGHASSTAAARGHGENPGKWATLHSQSSWCGWIGLWGVPQVPVPVSLILKQVLCTQGRGGFWDKTLGVAEHRPKGWPHLPLCSCPSPGQCPHSGHSPFPTLLQWPVSHLLSGESRNRSCGWMKGSHTGWTHPTHPSHTGQGRSLSRPFTAAQLSQSHVCNSALSPATSPRRVPQHTGGTGGYLTPEQVWEVQTPCDYWCWCCNTSIFPGSCSWEHLGHLAFHKHWKSIQLQNDFLLEVMNLVLFTACRVVLLLR